MELSVDFRVLGPVEVRVAGRPLLLGAPQTRAVLAVLLARRGEVISVDRLVDELWPDSPPEGARSLVHGHVSRVRRALRASPLGLSIERQLVTRKPGYLLCLEDQELDLARFERALTRARAAVQRGDLDRCVELHRRAHAEWRGEPYADVPATPLIAAEAVFLTGLRLDCLEERFDVELTAGRHGEVVGELTALVAHHPLRERLAGQLMLALYRLGNTAEALAVYQRTRRQLADQLGLDPGAALRGLHTAIVRGDAALGAPARPVGPIDGTDSAPRAPRQLPSDVAAFTGRSDELARLEQRLAAAGGQGPVVITAIQGAGGIGKSALAVHAAHRLAGRFPDGQLYVNLHGTTAGLQPLAPLEALGRFLRALGVQPQAVPTDLEEASAAFRSRVAGRRLLVVLDDARSVEQVRPLLPGTRSCGVLVTSRQPLASLDGARHLQLDVLAPGEAVQLLGRLAGPERVTAEPEAAAEVARLCGYLPLALRIAGARLAARPTWPVRALADRLADAQRRLDELELAEVGIRASFTVSYEQLRAGRDPVDGAAAEAFMLLGVLDGPEFGMPVVARLLDVANDAAGRVLERLVDAQLLETPAPGRYWLHDLLRLYARELASQKLLQGARAAAFTRALSFYVATAWHTLELLRPGDHRPAQVDDRWRKDRLEFTDNQEALGWLEAERANLVAAVQQAATAPGVPAEISVQLAQALFGFFYVRGHWEDGEQVNRTVLAVAQRIGDRAARARACNDLGVGYLRQGRYDRSLACHQESVALYRQLGDRHGQAGSLTNLGVVHRRRGRYAEALDCHQDSVAICRQLGDPYLQAISLHNLGVVYARLDRYEEALIHQQESLLLFKRLGDRTGEAECLNELGVVSQRQGRYDLALARHEESLAIRRELGDPFGYAECLRELGGTLRAVGCFNEARAHWLEALAIFEQLRTTAYAEQVRALLSDQPLVRPRQCGSLA